MSAKKSMKKFAKNVKSSAIKTGKITGRCLGDTVCAIGDSSCRIIAHTAFATATFLYTPANIIRSIRRGH